jgi:Methyltransferase domain
MHTEAFEWVRANAPLTARTVLDIGGRDVNGTPRGLFPDVDVYRVLDAQSAPEVDIVADAATWTPDETYDVVLACEVFEHTPVWQDIVFTASSACRPGGIFVATMAGAGRHAHSAIDGYGLRGGEHYANIDPGDLAEVLADAGFVEVVVDQAGADVRCKAVRP